VPPALARRAIRVTGLVQGVGFRPYVHALATGLGLAGFVGNDERGVFIEAEGAPDRIDRLLAELREHPPPLAQVTAVSARAVAVRGGSGFTIEASTSGGRAATIVPPIE